MSVEDFILIKYKKESLDLPTPHAKSYLAQQDGMFELMVKQIRAFYPFANIHVLTNDSFESQGLITHRLNFESNHCCKFFLYGLLDRPAIYLDCDILMLRQFTDEELKGYQPFKVFNTSGSFRGKQLWNAGIIWIPRPSHKIVADLQQIELELFSNKEEMISRKEWPYNDEYALSHYIQLNNFRYGKSKTVNILRHEVDSFFGLQTVHYTGFQNKKFFESEVRRSSLKIKIL